MKIGAKEFYYVFIIGIVLAFGGIAGAFYWGNKQLESEAANISNLLADSAVAQEKITALRKAQRSADRAEEAEMLLDTFLPKTKQQERLVADIIYTATVEAEIPEEQIGTIGFSTSTEPSDLSGTEQLKEVPGVYSYPFSMSVSDVSYETLLKLLQEIENNGRLVQVDDIQITPDKNKPGSLTNVSLSMKAFLKP